MDIWTLNTSTDSTIFNFPIEEDRTFFHYLIKNHFELSKSVFEVWRPLLLLRGEPRKQFDFFEIDGTDVIAISQKGVDVLKDYLIDKIELLPIITDAGGYYALNVLNYIDCLNKDDSDYLATNAGTIASYTLLDFIEEKLVDTAIFKIPELPYQIFITGEIQELCVEHELSGLVFDTEFNLVYYPE